MNGWRQLFRTSPQRTALPAFWLWLPLAAVVLLLYSDLYTGRTTPTETDHAVTSFNIAANAGLCGAPSTLSTKYSLKRYLAEHPDTTPPRLQVDTDDVRACLFIQCSTGSTGFGGCSNGQLAQVLPSGLIGCCVTGKGTVDLTPKCNNDHHDSDVYLLVDQGQACTRYKIEYHL